MRTIPFFLNCWLWRRRSGVLPRRPNYLGDARGWDYTGIRRYVTPFCLLPMLLLGCSQPALQAQPEAGRRNMPEQCTVYLVRHAEKQLIAGEKDPPLSAQGQQRALALASRLAQPGSTSAATIDRLYATGFQRTQLTLAPLAAALGKTVQIYDARQSAAFLSKLLSSDCHGALIVAGHSNTLPELLRAAGIDEPATEFDESRYGELFIVERQRITSGWQAQLRVERFGD